MDNVVIYGVIFVIYLAIMLIIGLFFWKRNEGMTDYLLGGRSLGPWSAALSAQASDMSGWLLLGLPGTAYALYIGTTEAIWTAIGLAVGTYLNWLIVSQRLRKYTQLANNSITIPDYLVNRFGDKTQILRVISGVFITLFFLVYTAAQFAAGAKLFNAVFGLDYTLALVIGAIAIVSYTFLGGFLAVCWTDVIQGAIMFFALLIVPFIAIYNTDVIENIMNFAASNNVPEFNLMPLDADGGVAWFALISFLAWGLGYCGQPHIIARFMATKSSKELRPARVIATIWVLVTLAAAVIIGIIGRVVVPDLADGESVFMSLVKVVFEGSPIIVGILMISILAAIMSTADSQLLVTSSAIANDIFSKIINKKATEKQLMLVAQMSVLVVSIIALVIALDPDSSVFTLVSYAWAGFGATFGPCIIISLFWKNMTRQAAYGGIISGGVVVIVWILLKQFGGIFDIYELFPAFVISTAVIFITSYFTKPEQALIDQHEAVLKCDY